MYYTITDVTLCCMNSTKNTKTYFCLDVSKCHKIMLELKNLWCLVVWKHGHWTLLLLFSAVLHVVVVVEELSLLLLLLLLKNVLQLATATNNYDIYGHPHDHWAWALAWQMAIRIHWLNWGLDLEDEIQYIPLYLPGENREQACMVHTSGRFSFIICDKYI